MQIGDSLRTLIVEPLELPVGEPGEPGIIPPEPEPLLPEPEPEKVPVTR
jgi:hypothetical protein